MQIELESIRLLELVAFKEALSNTTYKYPQMKELADIEKSIEVIISSNHDYVKGQQLMAVATTNGLENGYAKPEDYYFALRKADSKSTELVLCMKYQWYMNGKAYNPYNDGYRCRNFKDFDLPNRKSSEYEYDPQYYTASIETLREWFTGIGMEEKPELLVFVDEFIDANKERHGRK